MGKLAIHGGPPVIDGVLAPYRTIGEEERAAVDRVMRSGMLSGFIGEWCDAFYGGPEVRELEVRWTETFTIHMKGQTSPKSPAIPRG